MRMPQLNRIAAALSVAGCVTLLSIAAPTAYAQTISTAAGTGAAGSTGDGAAATAATLNRPIGVLVRADGSVLVAESSGNRVRKIDAAGVISTFAGNGTPGYTASAASATAATLQGPTGLAEDSLGNVYIGSLGSIQKVDASGALSTVAGNGIQANLGDGGAASDPAVRVDRPLSMRMDSSNNLFFADYNACVVRKISTANIISRVAGTGTCGSNGDGVAVTAHLNLPSGVFVNTDGTLLIGDGANNRVRKITVGGNITTIAGTGAATSSGDGGLATAATLTFPVGIHKDAAGNILVAELDGNRVRQIAPDGKISTVVGQPTVPAGTAGAATNLGDGGAPNSATATIYNPAAFAQDRAGNLYITSFRGNKVRKITFTTPPGPSVFKSFANTITAALGSISPEGEQTVPYGGTVKVTVTAKPRHLLRVASNCDYVKTSQPIAFVPNGTGTDTFNVTVNGPCQMEATFTPLIPTVNVNSEAAANALFTTTERTDKYAPPTAPAQTSGIVGKPVTFKAWVTDIAGVPYASDTNVITFKANGVAISGCVNVPLTLRGSNVLHIREANCVATFSPAGNVTITSEFAGDTYNFPATSAVLNHSVVAQ